MDLKQIATKWLPRIHKFEFSEELYFKDLVDFYWESSTLVDLHWHHMWLCSSKWFSCIYLKLFLEDHFTCEAI